MEEREEELVFRGLRKLGREGLDSSKYRGLRPQQMEAGLMHRTTRKKGQNQAPFSARLVGILHHSLPLNLTSKQHHRLKTAQFWDPDVLPYGVQYATDPLPLYPCLLLPSTFPNPHH